MVAIVGHRRANSPGAITATELTCSGAAQLDSGKLTKIYLLFLFREIFFIPKGEKQ